MYKRQVTLNLTAEDTTAIGSAGSGSLLVLATLIDSDGNNLAFTAVGLQRHPAQLPPARIPGLDATKISSGRFGTARLGSGTASNTNFLRGDGSWAAPPAGGGSGGGQAVLVASPGVWRKTIAPTSLLLNLWSAQSNAATVDFVVGGSQFNGRAYTGGYQEFAIALTANQASNITNGNGNIVITADIKNGSGNSLEQTQIRLGRDDVAGLVYELFSATKTALGGGSENIVFDVGNTDDTTGKQGSAIGANTFNIDAGHAALRGKITADWEIANPNAYNNDQPFDVEIQMIKASDDSVVDFLNIRGTSGKLEFDNQPAGGYKFAIRIRTSGRYSGTLQLTNLGIQSAVPAAQPAVREVMAAPLSDLEQHLQDQIDNIETSGDDSAHDGSYSIDGIVAGRAMTTVYSKLLFDMKLRSAGNDISIDSDSLLSLSPGQYKIEIHYVMRKASGNFGNNRANLKTRIINTSNADAVLDEQESLGYLRGSNTVNNEGVYSSHLIESTDSSHKIRVDGGLSQFEAGNTWQTQAGGRMTIYKIAGALKGEKGDPGPAGPGGGLSQNDVDNRVRALVADPAEQGNASAWPVAKIPNLPASKITSGTFATARIPGLDATKIISGRFNTARLGSGTASATNVLHGDGSWKAPTATSSGLRLTLIGSANVDIPANTRRVLRSTGFALPDAIANDEVFAWESKISDHGWTPLVFFSGYVWNQLGLLASGNLVNSSREENVIPSISPALEGNRIGFVYGAIAKSRQTISGASRPNAVLYTDIGSDEEDPSPLRIYKVG